MPEEGKYAYCIIQCPEERTFAEASPIGGGTGRVYTISVDGIALVVSDSSSKWYETTRANMMAHERVLERVMREYTLLPVRFGTMANSDSPVEEVRRLIKKRAPEFRRLLAEVDGKVELGIKAFWRDEKVAFRELMEAHPDIRRLRDSLLGKPPQAVRYEGIALGEMVKNALDDKRRKEAAALLAKLESLAQSTHENPTAGDKMVLNAAFLVDRTREDDFDRAVHNLETEVGQRVVMRYVGPVPPYNFVNIVVNWAEV